VAAAAADEVVAAGRGGRSHKLPTLVKEGWIRFGDGAVDLKKLPTLVKEGWPRFADGVVCPEKHSSSIVLPVYFRRPAGPAVIQTILVSDWIGKLKGSSSYYINHEVQPKALEWQRGYGIVTFGTKDLQWVVDYVNNQKEHHKNGTTRDRLEKHSDEEDDG
jgi:hypothetical protein